MRLTRWLYLRLLGLTALVAVGAYWVQLPGLAGRHGIAPIAEAMARLHAAPEVGFFDAPTLLWLSSSDAMLHLLCAVAVLASLLLLLGLAPRAALIALWASWLSLVSVGRPFLSFQWDVLLVEAAFFSIFFAPPGWRPRLADEPEPSRVARFLLFWLAARVTLESGLVKLASGDPSWRDLTALTYHWWTQPLPTWTAWWLSRLPLWAQKALCGGAFVLELPVPLLAFGPRRVRLVGGLGLLLLQLALMASGNFAFYNLLAFTLAVPLLDDLFLRRVWPGRLRALPELPPRAVPPVRRWQVSLAVVVVVLGVGAFFGRWVLESPLGGVAAAVQPFETINGYGAFAWMTKTRREIELEGSADGATWKPYVFKWKPGPLDRRPGFVAPWQPRLDWQMWFAALSECGDNPWLLSVQRHLLEGTPEVLALLEADPFPGAPPRYLRTRTFQYRFSSAPGQWWQRTEEGRYCPDVQLDAQGRLERAPSSLSP